MRLVSILMLLSGPVCANDTVVADVDALQTAMSSARPGDNLILREGEWRDVKLVFDGQGAPAAPITLRAASPGKTIICGSSTLRIGGEFLVVEGLCFQDPDTGISDDKKATLAPIETVFAGNQISSPRVAIIEARCDLGGITWQSNHFSGKSPGVSGVAGIETSTPQLKPLDPISRKEVGTSW